MKKVFITILAVGMMMLLSTAALASEAAPATFVCPKIDAVCPVHVDCINDGNCVNRKTLPRAGCKATAAASVTSANTTATRSASVVCPNTKHGACINNGQCQNAKSCPNGGVPKQDGTGPRGGLQGRGFHGGNRAS